MNIKFETKGSFDNVEKWLKKAVNGKPDAALRQIAKEGEKSLSSNTPKDTGTTASGWVSEITSKKGSSEIVWKNTAHPEAKVNIATIIDQGHGTGTGGYVPPRPYIKKSMEKVWATAGDRVAKELTK